MWGRRNILGQDFGQRLVDVSETECKTVICCAHRQGTLAAEEQRVGHFAEGEAQRKRRQQA